MSHTTAGLKVVGTETVSVSQHMPGLREKFLAPGADLACLRYDGEFGERAIREPALLTSKGKYVIFELPADARQEFIELCTALLEVRFPDWYMAEGAEGRFVWDLVSDSLTHTHSLRDSHDDDVEGVAPLTDPYGWCESDIPF